MLLIGKLKSMLNITISLISTGFVMRSDESVSIFIKIDLNLNMLSCFGNKIID